MSLKLFILNKICTSWRMLIGSSKGHDSSSAGVGGSFTTSYNREDQQSHYVKISVWTMVFA